MNQNQPFNNQEDYLYWMQHNCDTCQKSGKIYLVRSSSCEIFEAIADGMAGCEIPGGVATRIKMVEIDELLEAAKTCPERVSL